LELIVVWLISWLFWFVHRTPGAKVVSASQYEESIKKIGGFASVRTTSLPESLNR
jgi:hypothetical protein